MERFTKYWYVLIVVTSTVCSPTTREQTAEDEDMKPVSELSYVDLWTLMLDANNAQGIDVHGDGYGAEGRPFLDIARSGDCLASDCGSAMVLINSHLDTIKAVISFRFDLPGNPVDEMQRLYIVPGGQSTSLGCENFCYDGKSYPISPAIVTAGF